MANLTHHLKNQGALRLLLQVAAVCFIFILPFAEPSWHPSGADIFLGAVVPAMAPIVFILLMLDSLICVVWKSEATDSEELSKLGFAIKANLSVGLVLILLWFASFQDALVG